MDIKDFYLNNVTNRAEYIMIKISIIPQEFMTAYNLKVNMNNRYTFASNQWHVWTPTGSTNRT